MSMIRWIISSFCLLISLSIFGQGASYAPPVDPVSERYLREGQRFLELGKPQEALGYLEPAAERPFNQHSSLSCYLSGLAHYQLGHATQALRWFDRLADRFPGSRYLKDAGYHRGLIHLYSPQFDIQQNGIEELLALLDTYPNDSLLASDVQGHLQVYFQEKGDFRLLRDLAPQFPPAFRPLWVELACHHLTQAGNYQQARQLYQNYRRHQDPSWYSSYVEELLSQTLPPHEMATETRLALCLPFKLDEITLDSLGQLDPAQRLALEFYEGFELAMQAFQPLLSKQFHLKVIDSRKDELTLHHELGELDAFQPEMILGDIYNAQSTVIADWAENRAVPQLIPLSPSEELVAGKSHVFLAHPSAERHGEAMAEYAYLVQGVDRVAIWTDHDASTQKLAQSFYEAFLELGGQCQLIQLDSSFNPRLRKEIKTQLSTFRTDSIEGVYLPMLRNEETAGLILSEIQLQKLPLKVFASPAWYRRYERIDREMKEVYAVMFSTSYLQESSHPEYRNFFLEYLRQYNLPPSQFAVQGYDLGLYVLNLLDAYQPARDGSLSEFIRQQPQFHGLHQDIDFLGRQVNQFVNIGSFQDDGTIIKLNRRPDLNLELLNPVQNER